MSEMLMIVPPADKYSRKDDDEPIQYGTAGFRTKAEHLDHVVFRMGMLAVLRSKAKDSAAIGLMITASHNPEPDNGVKLIDPHGEMLDKKWESVATRLANAEDRFLTEELDTIVKEMQIDTSKPGLVYVGRDTRPSSEQLAHAALDGVASVSGGAVNHGVVTTPMLHYFVYLHNVTYKGSSDGVAFRDVYLSNFSSAFKALQTKENNSSGSYEGVIDFDGSNGVGALVMSEFLPGLEGALTINMFNTDTNTRGKLNNQCGADYVKVHQKPPEGVPITPYRKIVSVDGDADRIIYSFVDDQGTFFMLDGDNIATLVAGYLMYLVNESELNLRLGLVQTAYANGNSTKYISETLNVPVACTATGVKHLHKKALEYDFGVYFEANGHGTVVISENAENIISQALSRYDLPSAKREIVERLKRTTDVINTTVGDAISDMLLVESILYHRGWSVMDWASVYTNLPSRLARVAVKDRNKVKVMDADRVCVGPEGLQDAIDKVVSNYTNGRSFVRPSGTEDVVRVYAEASTQEDADELAIEVTRLVHQMAGGIGPLPS